MRIMAAKGGGRVDESGGEAGEKLEQTRRLQFVQARVCLERLAPMQKIQSVSEMRALAARLQADGKSIALVPTSGALHAGHAALIAAAEARADAVVVSVFANPLAFGPSEKFDTYPRSPDADAKLCEELGVDAVFMPAVEEMLPRGYSTQVIEDAVGKPLCGVSRPTHFRGVTTLAAKLLNIVHPTFVVLGQKDAQLAAVVRKMIADLLFGVEVVVVPTVRESDGLAINVRNRDLTSNQRQDALAIYAALRRAQEMVGQGVRSTDRVVAEATHLLGERRRVRVIYVSMVDEQTMEPMREIVPGRTLLAIAVWVDEVRLTDNVLL
jgi:pantoate--beta-alanine ligase